MARTLVGTRIRERRRNLELTQAGLARAAGISASYLNLIEHNRRGIAGRTLLAIATQLGINASELTEGADSDLINQLTEITKGDTSVGPELDRIEEFVGRYPGWAKFLTTLGARSRQQTEALLAMTDRLDHDPFLAETMHQILSNITAIRSTASILDSTPDITEHQRTRFLGNLRRESQRLSTAAQSMVDFFDTPEPDMITPARSQSDLQDFWTSNNHYLEDVETGATTTKALFLRHSPGLSATSTNLQRSLERYQQAVHRLPIDRFRKHAIALHFDPLALATEFQAPLDLVLFRLAHMPQDPDLPVFGLIECDMSGAVLQRKEIPEFALPQYSSACPLWPIYRAFGNPNQPIRATLEMPNGARMMTYSIAQTAPADRYDLPPFLHSVMVFSGDPRATASARDTQQPILAGLHCSVCPRKNCAQRRVDYILA